MCNNENEFEKNSQNVNETKFSGDDNNAYIPETGDKARLEENTKPKTNMLYGDNDISADDIEKSALKKTEEDSVSAVKETESQMQAQNQNQVNETVSEHSEIVYNSDSKNSGYSCNYIHADQVKKKRSRDKSRGRGMKVCALVIAAVFTLTFVAFSAFTICDKMGYIDEYRQMQEDNEPVFQMDVPDSSKSSVENVLSVSDPDASASSSEELTVKQIADKCLKSSVGILVEKQQYYFGASYTSAGVGSGFILSEDGYIATNNHVVSGATKITVVLNDGTEYEAELVGADSITDVAVVKIDAEGLPVMERGNSDDAEIGDLVVAIGTPASIELAGTVTDGIISAVDRKIDITDDYGRVVKTMTLIQTNAVINPGNSGGPLINSRGQVIGINTLKLTDEYEGIGFAIPINGAISIMNQLIADGTVTDRSESLVVGKASIGIQCVDITDQEAEYYGIPKGVLVMQINKTGSAAQAGLRRGDIIIEFNGERVESIDEVNAEKDKFNAGDEVTIRVFRDGEGELDITFNLDMQE